MKDVGLRPNEVTYTSLIDLFVKQNDPEGAFELLREMKNFGLRPNEVTYNVLIELYINNNDLEMAGNVFDNRLQFHLKQEKGCDVLDCHELSHGAACIMLYKYLNSESKKTSFIIVTGIGKHSKNKYEMKQAIILFLGKHFPNLSHQSHSKNKGRVLIREKS